MAMRSLPLLLLALAASPAAAQRGAVPSGCQEDYATCKEDCSIEYGGSSRTVKKLTQCLGICMENRSECSDRHSAIRGLPEGVVADEPRPRRIPNTKPVNREDDPFGDASPNRDTETTRRPTNREDDPFGESRPERPPGPRGEYRADTMPAEDTRPAPEEASPPPPRDTEPVPTVSRQGVYRTPAAEPKPPPAPAPEPAPASDLDEGLEPLDTPPAPTPTAATKPAPARSSPPPKSEPAMASSTEEKDPLLDEEPPPPPPKPTAAAKKPPPPPPSNSSRPAIPPEPKKQDISEWDPNGD